MIFYTLRQHLISLNVKVWRRFFVCDKEKCEVFFSQTKKCGWSKTHKAAEGGDWVLRKPEPPKGGEA
jgi:hypothetical protein